MKFKVLCHEGDALYDYDVLEMAKIKFDELVGSGLLPMVIEKEGNRMLNKFESGADEITWIPAVMGG